MWGLRCPNVVRTIVHESRICRTIWYSVGDFPWSGKSGIAYGRIGIPTEYAHRHFRSVTRGCSYMRVASVALPSLQNACICSSSLAACCKWTPSVFPLWPVRHPSCMKSSDCEFIRSTNSLHVDHKYMRTKRESYIYKEVECYNALCNCQGLYVHTFTL